jgi:signal transduction histidine kinase
MTAIAVDVSRSESRETSLRLRLPPWLPKRERSAIEEFGVEGRPIRYLASVAFTLGVVAIPCVTQATGVDLRAVALIFVIHAAWIVAANRLLYPRAHRSLGAFYALAFGMVLQGTFISLSLPVLAHEPCTPLWVAYLIMACAVGASESEASLSFGMFFPLGPLATVPLYLAQGHPLSRAVAGPLVTSFASGYGYWYIARRRDHWRRDRHENEMALAAGRLEESERERRRLSRDLHDSVGTTLSLVALYGALAEGRSDDAAEARRLAATIRAAALSGLNELRGVLQALPQAPATIDELAEGMAFVAQRTVEPAGARFNIVVQNGGDTVVHGGLRSMLVRVFQEAVHNAVHHGRAARIDALLAAQDGRIRLEISDDGGGFDPALPRGGTGIAGMRERARELGGDVTVESAVGIGARVRLELPFPTETAA